MGGAQATTLLQKLGGVRVGGQGRGSDGQVQSEDGLVQKELISPTFGTPSYNAIEHSAGLRWCPSSLTSFSRQLCSVALDDSKLIGRSSPVTQQLRTISIRPDVESGECGDQNR